VLGAEFGALSDSVPAHVATNGCVARLVGSWKFNLFIAATILFNSITVCIEELGRTEDNKDHAAWLIADAIFTSIFVLEFVLKFAWMTCYYFYDAWNRFDFFLVIVGVLGLIMNTLTQGGGVELAGQTRVMRLARVLRTMRFLRVFRLFNAKLSADKFVSLELAKHMKKITTMSCFISAHLTAQNDLVKYFGGNGKLDEANESEIARCILQSQLAVYKALFAAANTQKQISEEVLHELQTLYKRKTITEGLSHFVEQALRDGAISNTEAHAILHPLNHQVSRCMKALNDRAEGVMSKGADGRATMNVLSGECLEERRPSKDMGATTSLREQVDLRLNAGVEDKPAQPELPEAVSAGADAVAVEVPSPAEVPSPKPEDAPASG
jgi:hypothetical protein